MLWVPTSGVWQGRFKEGSPGPSLQMSHSWPLCSSFSAAKRAGVEALAAAVRRPSELLQAAVHLSLALFPCPGPALGAELLQVFFKVLMVHGPVAGRLTVRLRDKSGGGQSTFVSLLILFPPPPWGCETEQQRRTGQWVLRPLLCRANPQTPGKKQPRQIRSNCPT